MGPKKVDEFGESDESDEISLRLLAKLYEGIEINQIDRFEKVGEFGENDEFDESDKSDQNSPRPLTKFLKQVEATQIDGPRTVDRYGEKTNEQILRNLAEAFDKITKIN